MFKQCHKSKNLVTVKDENIGEDYTSEKYNLDIAMFD